MKYYVINTEDFKGIVNYKLYELITLQKADLINCFESKKNLSGALEVFNNLDLPKQKNPDENLSNKDKSNSKLDKPDVLVWTDGGSRNTGNISGEHVHSNDESAWAYRILYDNQEYIDSDSDLGKTNNEMELKALNQALMKLLDLKLNNHKVTIYSDSMYVINAVSKWSKSWKASGWKRKGKYPIKNIDLIKNIDSLKEKFSSLNFSWVKGHTDLTDPIHEGNNLVDGLLNKSMNIDSGEEPNYRPSINHERLATARQLKYLKSLDPSFSAREGLTVKEASQLISQYLKEK